MKDDQHRIEAYNAKTVATTVGLKVASQLSTMKSAFATACSSFVAKEVLTQAVLNGEGNIPVIQYPFYLNFAREMWALASKGITGAVQVAHGTLLKTKYSSYGLDGLVLSKIALDVFAVVVP